MMKGAKGVKYDVDCGLNGLQETEKWKLHIFNNW